MKLKQAREESGKSQMTVAVETGLAITSYRSIEYGQTRRPTITNVYGIAASIGADPHDIDEFVETLTEYEVAKANFPVAQQSGEAERYYNPARFQAAFRHEVDRRMEVLAGQSMGGERTAAQSNESVT